MQDSTPISAPAGYVPAYAVGYAAPDETYIPVTAAQPLPVALTEGAATNAPLAGEASADTLAGPFEAVAGKVVLVALEGDFVGSATLLRSIDGGTTKQALCVAGETWGEYTRPGIEQAWLETESGASFYLQIAVSYGALSYRVSQ